MEVSVHVCSMHNLIRIFVDYLEGAGHINTFLQPKPTT